MTEQILEALRANIEALPFIEKFGGLARPVSKSFVIDQQTGKTINKTFPIGCNVSGVSCWDNGRFLDLVPNDTKLSVSYFEAPNRLTISDYTGPKRSIANWVGVVRFVCWLNGPLLGRNDCGFSGVPILNLTEAINGRLRGVIIPEDTVYFQVESEEAKTADIFKQYSYDEQKQYLFYPFDYFALNISVKYSVPSGCALPFVLNPPIECVDDQ
jgi:hypothetical protein